MDSDVRRIDDLGRVVISKDTRAKHGIEPGDPLEIISYRGVIVVKKHMSKQEIVAFSCEDCPNDGDCPVDCVVLVINKKDIEYCEECGKPVHKDDPHFITENGDIIHKHCAGPYAVDYMNENQLWSLHKDNSSRSV